MVPNKCTVQEFLTNKGACNHNNKMMHNKNSIYQRSFAKLGAGSESDVYLVQMVDLCISNHPKLAKIAFAAIYHVSFPNMVLCTVSPT